MKNIPSIKLLLPIIAFFYFFSHCTAQSTELGIGINTNHGGNALKFYASVRLDIRRSGAAIKDKEGNVVGNHVKVKVVKNKLAPPFRIAEFDIMYGEGISKTGEIVDLGVDHDIVGKSGSWYSYNGAKIAQGREGAKSFLRDNPEVADEIEQLIKAKIAGVKIEDAQKNGQKKEKKETVKA